MDISYYKKYEPIDGKWYITNEIGSGAFGTVFEITRKDFPDMKAALKVISIPTSQKEIDNYREENYDLDEKSVTSYFESIVDDVTKEFRLMAQLKGNTNIVGYEDHDVKPKEGEFGWDIFIRMELLTPMNRYFAENNPTQKDVIQLGIDICKALEICQKYQIIHRDIKPSNIFVSNTGDFKLGDFGVARTLEKTTSGLSKKGTYTYMAPEVFKGEAYNSNVDIYSLGILMYKLLNNNMEPFRTDRTYGDSEKAFEKRMLGASIPAPANAKGRLAEIVLKACSFSPKERYESPLQMRAELENILYNDNEKKIIYPEGDVVGYEASTNGETEEKTVSLFGDFTEKEDKKENKTVSVFDINKAVESEHKENKEVEIREQENKVIKTEVSKTENKKFKWSFLGIIALVLLSVIGFVVSQHSIQSSGWTGFVHSYNVDADGRFSDGKTIDNTGTKDAISTDLGRIITDNIPSELPLDKWYDFKLTIKAEEKPYSVSLLLGKGSSYQSDNDVEYSLGKVNLDIPWCFKSEDYSAGDEIRLRIVLSYETKNSDGSMSCKKIYYDKTILTLTEKQ